MNVAERVGRSATGALGIVRCLGHFRLEDAGGSQLQFRTRKARAMLANGIGIMKIAEQLGVGTGTIQKIKRGEKLAHRCGPEGSDGIQGADSSDISD